MNLYIHIPFCASKCSYCHFYSICDQSLIEAYLKAVATELSHYLTTKPSTIYIGGGTPSLLNPNQLETLISLIDVSNVSEITLEAHPNTLTKSKIKDYYQIGINRLSLGIQSWNQQILADMNRQYDESRVKDLIVYAQSIGLTNINIDHILAYPYQTDRILEADLTKSLTLNPAHVSIYPLERHPHTGIKKSPSAAKIVHQFALIQNLLTNHGYLHYEELNFCRPGFECRHNLNFWQGKDYLGVGASAVSKIGNLIRTNPTDLSAYLNDPIKSHTETQLTDMTNQSLVLDLQSRILGG